MTRVLMVASSVVLLLVGLAWLFLPVAMSGALGHPVDDPGAAQFAAVGPLGLAAVNWVGRGAIYGGIYGRPIVVGNFVAAGATTLILLPMQAQGPSLLGVGLLVVFAAYWAAFARLLLRPPPGWDRAPDPSG